MSSNQPKYSSLEIERRWLVTDLSQLTSQLESLPCRIIEDVFLDQTRMRVRKVMEEKTGEVEYKLCKKYGHKCRGAATTTGASATVEPITNIYLSPAEYTLFSHLPGHRITKKRYTRDGGGALDVYNSSDDDAQPLVIFEMEFVDESKAAAYSPPKFITKEVTGLREYEGAFIGRYPSLTLYNPPPPSHAHFQLHATLHKLKHPEGRVLLIGDIHGCYSELISLITLAKIDHTRDTVIALGDLIAKGPDSQKVVEYLMKNQCLAILGNHDAFLMRCALLAGRFNAHLKEEERRVYKNGEEIGVWTEEEVKKTDTSSLSYALSYYARMPGFHSVAKPDCKHYKIMETLSDEELLWIAKLPCTIDVKLEGMKQAYRCVHAGMVPNLGDDVKGKEKQHPFQMVIMRNLTPIEISFDPSSSSSSSAIGPQYEPSERAKSGTAWTMVLSEEEKRYLASSAEAASSASASSAAASSSSSSSLTPPPTLVFGHDAKRGFQRPNLFRLGLDTAACNGRSLTGLLLPDERILSVKSTKEHEPPKEKGKEVARLPPEQAFQSEGILLKDIPFTDPAFAVAH